MGVRAARAAQRLRAYDASLVGTAPPVSRIGRAHKRATTATVAQPMTVANPMLS
jgi:hypothetical protein